MFFQLYKLLPFGRCYKQNPTLVSVRPMIYIWRLKRQKKKVHICIICWHIGSIRLLPVHISLNKHEVCMSHQVLTYKSRQIKHFTNMRNEPTWLYHATYTIKSGQPLLCDFFWAMQRQITCWDLWIRLSHKRYLFKLLPGNDGSGIKGSYHQGL